MRTRLLLLTDRAQLSKGRSLSRTVAECVDAGLEAVVVREHDLAPRDRRALLDRLAELAGLTVISSRIADPAAHGLHLAAHQERVDGWHGRSCHSADDVRRAVADGASWATLSPYAATASKPGHGPPLPHDAFARDAGIPVFALGGIDPGNARAAVEAGAHGVAVMGAVMRAAEPAHVVARLLAELR
ncbi:thiamine phosphate synthase [Nocardioides sp. LS1]|uniref:thiamine phosphate synthase n=1 Tax=Nocardioides sp. LS1 TaxID=1027620 RepID=UPI000F618652|nr:thiamine phosphate synthase [Nocardioides sp. LS1]GCD91239.1 putative thiamine-phosphate synthase [Nocardioides sp. LS1]